MSLRRFLFSVPADLLIGIDAPTEAEAWLVIKRLRKQHFCADHDSLNPCLPGVKIDRHVTIYADFAQSELLGKEEPRDDSDTRGAS